MGRKEKEKEIPCCFISICRNQAWLKKKKEEACKRLRYGNLTKTLIFLCLGLEKNPSFV